MNIRREIHGNAVLLKVTAQRLIPSDDQSVRRFTDVINQYRYLERPLILDLREVKTMNSDYLGSLMMLHMQLHREETCLVLLVTEDQHLLGLLRRTHCDGVFKIANTLEDAIILSNETIRME